MQPIICTMCEREISSGSAIEFDGQILYPDCLDLHTVTCTCCERRLWHDSNYGDSDTPLCEDCYYSHYTSCERCGRVIHNHPFRGNAGNQQFALAHNGMLYNDRYLRLQYDLPKTDIETDSYIAVQLIEKSGKVDFPALADMAEKLEGSFTITVMDEQENLYIIIRKQSDLHLSLAGTRTVSVRVHGGDSAIRADEDFAQARQA